MQREISSKISAMHVSICALETEAVMENELDEVAAVNAELDSGM